MAYKECMIHLFLGVLLTALGIGTIWIIMFAPIVSIYIIGWIILTAGVGQFFYGVTSGNLRMTLFYVITGLFSVFLGLLAVTNPALPAITFAFLIGTLLLISGIYRIAATLITREENWGWALTGGITSLVLGSAVVLTWPLFSFFFIGMFLGIELIINGALVTMQPAILYDEQRAYPISPFLAGIKGGKSKKKTQNKNQHLDKDYADRNYTKSRSRKID